MNVVLKGIVGSQAYGMATEDSDVDELGVFVADTEDIVGLGWNQHKESQVTNGPDVTLHEIGKLCRLGLKCNPTISELLWLPDYLVITPDGHELRAMRHHMLSKQYVFNSYGGYAAQQVGRLRGRGDGSFSADTRKRTAKHARHCYRLILQGTDLLTEGVLAVRMDQPSVDRCFEMGELAMTNLDLFLKWWEVADQSFKEAADVSLLPEQPNLDAVNNFLIRVRRDYWR